VDQRFKVDITNLVSRAVSNVSMSGGVFQMDVAITSNSTQTYVPYVDLNVVSVNSGTGTVKVINADNGKDGKTTANAALFGYSQKLGADQLFTPGEVSGARTLRFQDSTAELFTFDALVTAYVSTSGTERTGGSGGPGAPPGGASGGQSTGGGTGLLTQITAVLRFTANPITRTVTAQLVSLR